MTPQRLDGLDALRGLALLWMTAFHFCFDLNQAGYIHQNFYSDPLWTWQRTCILSLFLLCAGAGQALSLHQGQSWARFGRRWLQIALCALLVTAGSALMFPKSFIYFGVLHGMVVMLVIVRLTASWGRWLWPLGAVAIAMQSIAARAIDTGAMGTFFNEKRLNWLGLVNVKPVTEDYVPIFPWLGVMWWGMAAMQWWLRRPRTIQPPQAWLHRLSPVGMLGRWSLSYYMLHQPVLLAGLWVVAVLRL